MSAQSRPNPKFLHPSNSPAAAAAAAAAAAKAVVDYSDGKMSLSTAACVTMEHRKEIENLEVDWNALYYDEKGLDGRCRKIVMSFFNNFTISLVVMGLGSACVCGVISSGKRTLYLLFAMMAMIFLLGIGRSAFAAFNEFKKVQPLVSEIKQRKLRLRKIVSGVQDELNKAYGEIQVSSSDRWRLTLMEDTLGIKTGGFKEDYIGFLLVICGVSLVYLLLIFTCIFFMPIG